MRQIALLILLGITALNLCAEPVEAYYRQPTLHETLLVFAAEGDLWKVDVDGGTASRLTTHLEVESHPALSPDGEFVAFSASYEGPSEIYIMSSGGGLPRRLTFDAANGRVAGWHPDGRLLYRTQKFSTLPNHQLVAIDLETLEQVVLPLAQASDGSFDAQTGTLYFTRLSSQWSSTKRYQGGTAQNIWRFDKDADEALPMTADYLGTSRHAMFWNDRVYFASDRDGSMNLWSMLGDGGDLRQHTRHAGWDIHDPELQNGRIVYQLGADIHLYDIAADRQMLIPIQLLSDLEQTRERWLAEPMDYLSSARLSQDGSRVVTINRGRAFVHPVKQGRRVELSLEEGLRFRSARFLPETDSLILLSDASGEVEWWKYPADGIGEARQLSEDGQVLRFDGIPSPDGRWIASWNQDQEMRLIDVESGDSHLVAFSQDWGFERPCWSPDSRFFTFGMPAKNGIGQLHIYDLKAKEVFAITSDRFHSVSPCWSPTGEWIYFLSDRHFQSIVHGPWGQAQPEPFFDKQTLVFALPLRDGLRFPFDSDDELWVEPEDDEDDEVSELRVEIDRDGLSERLRQVPLAAGNFRNLSMSKDRLFWMNRPRGEWTNSLMALDLDNEDIEAKSLVSQLASYELSGNGEKILIRQAENLFVIDSSTAPDASLQDAALDLSAWKFSIDPKEEWRQMFLESWRLERDYFYDRDMHGVDWDAVLEKYMPLVDRVRSREDLADLQRQMASELSALHVYVWGGDQRRDENDIDLASLGALLRRDEKAGGYRIETIYRSDPDLPERRSPLDRPGLDVREGDLIVAINGTPLLSTIHPGRLLRNQIGRQTRLELRRGRRGESWDLIVTPIAASRERSLRYDQWELERRERVDEAGEGEIGYVHLRAMGSGNYSEWQRHFFPVFERAGLIIDVRHNGGGNIDSWILSRLLRQAWMFWSPRVGDNYWNMHYAFRGHMVVLVDEWTASDGEAFADGFRRLGLGKIIGTRSWGGEIWLTSSNTLVDRGIVTAPEFGVYGPEGKWLIEGVGVEPDIVVDNLPHETYLGRDAQLDAAVEHLRHLIEEDPRPMPMAPPRPDKSFTH
jgi:tricorn protease